MRGRTRRVRATELRAGRRRRTALGVAALAAVPLALAGSAPAAADDCPNAAARTGASAHLPECRAYELVTPVEKGGTPVTAALMVSPDGKIAYDAVGASFADAASSVNTIYSSHRTEEGWRTFALVPPTLTRPPHFLDEFFALTFSPDFERALVHTTYPVDPDDQGSGAYGTPDIYRVQRGGRTTWISHGATLPDVSPLSVHWGGSSDDLERVVFHTRRALVPEIRATTTDHVYIGDGETTRLVSVGEDGRPLPTGGVMLDAPSAYFAIEVGGSARRSVSSDGATVVFMSPARNGQLYVRTDAFDPAAGATRQITRSADGAVECRAPAYQGMSRDGHRVAFGCGEDLLGDGAGGGSYVYDTRARTLARVSTIAAGTSGANGNIVAADDELDHLYYRAEAVHAPGGVAGRANLYVRHDGVTRHVAVMADTQYPIDRAVLSPDGAQIAFAARGASVPGRDAGGFEQVYHYDAVTGRLDCASCPLDGSPATGEARFQNVGDFGFRRSGKQVAGGAISADGRRVFFTSWSRLVPEDVNGVADVYMLLDGRHHLISPGNQRHAAVFAGASADATDVFLLSVSSLVPQDVDEGVADVYSARVGGGFPLPPGRQPCDADCQGPPAAPLPLPGPPGSLVVGGDGNLPDEALPRAARVAVGGRRSVRGPRAVLRVRVSGRGVLTVAGRSVRRTARYVHRAATYRVAVRLAPRQRRRLAQRSRVRAAVRVTYRAQDGSSATRRVRLTFRRPRRAVRAADAVVRDRAHPKGGR